jgi:hypothetical protein
MDLSPLKNYYNCSETIKKGCDDHATRDIAPHSEATGFSVDPPRFSDLSGGTFPATDRRGRILAETT